MPKFESKHANLGFYFKDELKTFASGIYVTEDKAEIAVLNKLKDAKRVKEEVVEAPKEPVDPPTEPPEKTDVKDAAQLPK